MLICLEVSNFCWLMVHIYSVNLSSGIRFPSILIFMFFLIKKAKGDTPMAETRSMVTQSSVQNSKVDCAESAMKRKEKNCQMLAVRVALRFSV